LLHEVHCQRVPWLRLPRRPVHHLPELLHLVCDLSLPGEHYQREQLLASALECERTSNPDDYAHGPTEFASARFATKSSFLRGLVLRVDEQHRGNVPEFLKRAVCKHRPEHRATKCVERYV